MNDITQIKPKYQSAEYVTENDVTVIEQRNPTYDGGTSHIQKEGCRGEPGTKAVCGRDIDRDITRRVTTQSIDTVSCDGCKEIVTE